MPSAAHDVKKLILPPGQTLNKHMCAERQQARGWVGNCTNRGSPAAPPVRFHSFALSFAFFFPPGNLPLPPPILNLSLIQKQNVKTKGKKRAKK